MHMKTKNTHHTTKKQIVFQWGSRLAYAIYVIITYFVMYTIGYDASTWQYWTMGLCIMGAYCTGLFYVDNAMYSKGLIIFLLLSTAVNVIMTFSVKYDISTWQHKIIFICLWSAFCTGFLCEKIIKGDDNGIK